MKKIKIPKFETRFSKEEALEVISRHPFKRMEFPGAFDLSADEKIARHTIQMAYEPFEKQERIHREVYRCYTMRPYYKDERWVYYFGPIV